MKVSRPARSFGSDDESSDFSAAPETDSDASESESNDDTNNQTGIAIKTSSVGTAALYSMAKVRETQSLPWQ